MKNRKFTSAFFTALVFLFVMKPASAYIDPSSGSYMIQMLIAGIVGVMFAVKSYWTSIKLFVAERLLRKKIEADDSEPDHILSDDS